MKNPFSEIIKSTKEEFGIPDDKTTIPQNEQHVIDDYQQSVISNPANLKKVYQDAYNMYLKFPKEDLAKILAGYALEREANKQDTDVDYNFASSIKRKF